MRKQCVPGVSPFFARAGDEASRETDSEPRDFRIWTQFLRKYVYFRVIGLDFNPWATADLL